MVKVSQEPQRHPQGNRMSRKKSRKGKQRRHAAQANRHIQAPIVSPQKTPPPAGGKVEEAEWKEGTNSPLLRELPWGCVSLQGCACAKATLTKRRKRDPIKLNRKRECVNTGVVEGFEARGQKRRGALSPGRL